MEPLCLKSHLQAKCLCTHSRKNGEAPGLAGHGVRVQAETRWWLRCRLPVWETVETGHKRWGWQSQRGWGRRFG